MTSAARVPPPLPTMTFAHNRHADRPSVALPALWGEGLEVPPACELATVAPALLLVQREMRGGVNASRQLDAAIAVHDVKKALAVVAFETPHAHASAPASCPAVAEPLCMTGRLIAVVGAAVVELSALLASLLAMP